MVERDCSRERCTNRGPVSCTGAVVSVERRRQVADQRHGGLLVLFKQRIQGLVQLWQHAAVTRLLSRQHATVTRLLSQQHIVTVTRLLSRQHEIGRAHV